MGKKASLSVTKGVQIVILHKERLFERKICKKVACSITAVHQAIAKFQKFELYHYKKKEVEGQEKQALEMTT